ncbi:ExbD/TolR family protein [Sulfitobacter sabulilitoris]|uniref:Biopolymer transporter ExbD n=1 Tax=Sulfitobacter sabulilitoris TaxID=2562655 RepID=A0A5S3PIK3_9RHOB|nr:biopolymer transporter ExbD [Sulfitobacter sabulilitoris]TMM54121.1 biopolymer transporter ExbD [Sulfitobacter sabulilitoris]
MKLARAPRRTPPETIIALIDVVFFLLVFFMLIGRMDATAPFDVTPATARTGADMPGGGVTLAIATDGALALGGAGVSRAQALEQIAQTLQSAPDRLIRVNAHQDAPLSEVLPLVAEIEAMGARDVVLVVTPPAP